MDLARVEILKMDLARVGALKMDLAGVRALEMNPIGVSVIEMDLMKGIATEVNLKTRVVMAAVEVAATELKMIAVMEAAKVNRKKKAAADLEVVATPGVRGNRAVSESGHNNR